jgi:hypothetical protein
MADIPRDQKQVESWVMIGNVLQRITNNREWRDFETVWNLVFTRKEKSHWLHKENDNTIDFILDLIEQNFTIKQTDD